MSMDEIEKKYLVLFNARWPLDRYMIKNVNLDLIEVAAMYKVYKKDLKYIMAALWMQKCKLPFQFVWYEKWKKQIKSYDIVIINAQNLDWQILSYIKKKNPDARLIVWYWDTVSKEKYLPEKYRSICEVWSFDAQDCAKYGMRKNVQFYYPLDIEIGETLYDAVFVGRDKGRTQQIQEISDCLQKNGLKVFVYIQRDKKNKEHSSQKHSKTLEYEEIIKKTIQSRCIIDIPKSGQSGMTIRVLESMFYSKKLITTDKSLFEAEFYNPANILIWDKPDEDELRKFFSLPYEPVSKEILDQYTFETWINNFGRQD